MHVVMVSIHLEITMVDLLREVVAYFRITVIVLKELVLVEDFVCHERNRCFLQNLTENEDVKLNIIEVVQGLIKLILSIVIKTSHFKEFLISIIHQGQVILLMRYTSWNLLD